MIQVRLPYKATKLAAFSFAYACSTAVALNHRAIGLQMFFRTASKAFQDFAILHGIALLEAALAEVDVVLVRVDEVEALAARSESSSFSFACTFSFAS